MYDLISRQDAIKNAHFPTIDDAGYEVVRVDDILTLPSEEPKTKCVAQIRINRDDIEDLVNEKVNEIVDKMSEPKTDGVFVKGGLTISGESLMPEGCMDCKLQNRCLCISPNLSADEISELYISRRPNCPLSMIAEPKTGRWIEENFIPHCSECGKSSVLGGRFCPNCGADMRG